MKCKVESKLVVEDWAADWLSQERSQIQIQIQIQIEIQTQIHVREVGEAGEEEGAKTVG